MLVVLPILILEPGLVAFTGGTVGHHLLRIRVAKRDGARNINVVAAIVRFVVKLLLGWLSFIFVLTTAKHQAVHDLVAGSIVRHKDAAGLPPHEVLPERVQETDAFFYPPAWRRVVVIAGYWVLMTVGVGIAGHLLLSAGCSQGRRCTATDYLLNDSLSIAWLVGVGWITVLGGVDGCWVVGDVSGKLRSLHSAGLAEEWSLALR